MRTPIIDGRSIEQFIPANLRHMFYDHAMPQYKYAIHDGYDPYGFTVDGLVLYLPLWALKGSPIQSVDAYKHTFDIIGALWTPTSRNFTGGDDYLRSVIAGFRSGDSQGAIEIWFKTGTSGLDKVLFGTGDEATSDNFFMFYIAASTGKLTVNQKNAGSAAIVAGGTNVEDSVWHHVVLSSSGTAYTIILDGVAETLSGTNNGDWFADTDNRDNITIGAVRYSAIANYFYGDIGEVRVYSSPLILAEAQHNRNCTSWRYQ